MRKLQLILLVLALAHGAVAQPPVITSVMPATTYPSDQVIITGSGFSATSSQLQVWFNQVKGTIVSSSEFSITVNVPASAKMGVIEVLNLSTRLSAKSSFKFTPYYSGTTFDQSKLGAPLTFSGANEQFDVYPSDLNADGKPELLVTQFDGETDLVPDEAPYLLRFSAF